VLDEHWRQVAVEYDIARIEIILEQAAIEVRRNDHAYSRQFVGAELTDLASWVGHK
jgi:hypothetical protein